VTSEAIRRAVAAGDYVTAATLFDQFARSLPPDESSLAELGDLAQWTRLTVLCAKAHAEDEARSLQAGLRVAAAYAR
jgi:hypothetical protein